MKITGSILKEARERKNITLNEVAYATKINLKALQAIESGDIPSLPPKAFVRGFVQVYADYLKLDVASIMIQFHEEMGSTKPVFADTLETKDVKPVSNVQSAGQVVLDSRGVEDEMKESSSSLVKMSIFVAAILVVAVAIVAQKTFKKYENEKVGSDATSAVTSTTLESLRSGVVSPPLTTDSTLKTSDSNKTSVDLGKDVTSPTSGNTSLSAIVGSVGPLTSMTTSTSRSTTTLRATTSTTLRPTTLTTLKIADPIKAAEPVHAKKPVTEPGAAAIVTSDGESTTTTTLAPAAAPQEVILEALDQVDVSFRIDSGSSQTLNLKPNQIHTFKAKGKIQLEVSDGGAVNVIHNGQDRGVPGTLGQSLKLRYP